MGEHYLVLSELVSHKRIDTAISAFNALGLPLVVAGDGPDRRRLSRLAGPTIRFTGRVSDAHAAQLMASCRAFVVTGMEEFGIAAVEAQAAGRPVIARAGGGLLETVVDGTTGCFWDGGEAELANAGPASTPRPWIPRPAWRTRRASRRACFGRRCQREVDAALRARQVERGDREMHAPRRPAQGRRRRFAVLRARGRAGGAQQRRELAALASRRAPGEALQQQTVGEGRELEKVVHALT